MEVLLTPEQIVALLNRGLAIQSRIYLDIEKRKKLFSLMSQIAPTGDQRFLSTRDRLFTYCNERDVWYGSSSTHLPYVNIDKL